jgi:hypothetical protein
LAVAMRARNPCFLARRRLLGWNVRFTSSSPGWAIDGRTSVHRRRGRAALDARRLGTDRPDGPIRTGKA